MHNVQVYYRAEQTFGHVSAVSQYLEGCKFIVNILKFLLTIIIENGNELFPDVSNIPFFKVFRWIKLKKIQGIRKCQI